MLASGLYSHAHMCTCTPAPHVHTQSMAAYYKLGTASETSGGAMAGSCLQLTSSVDGM